jgi:hypothetical protein
MNPATKKGIYGFVFLLVFVLLSVWVYFSFLKPAPTCSDGIQNQDEEGIDCGGGCVACEVLTLQDIRVAREPKIFSTIDGKSMVLLAEVLNPNSNYQASKFSYDFLLYDAGGNVIETVSGEESINALERKLIVETNVHSYRKSVARVSLVIKNPQWTKSFDAVHNPLTVSEGPETDIANGEIRVRGKIRNEGNAPLSNIRVVSILADSRGGELFASQTFLTSMQAFEERSFVVFFPSDTELAKTLDPDHTQVFAQAE